MLRSKSVSRLLGGAAAALLLAADLTGLRAGDEQFQLPLPAAADPAVTANFPTGDVPPTPAAKAGKAIRTAPHNSADPHVLIRVLFMVFS